MAYIGRRYAGWFDGVDDYVKISTVNGFPDGDSPRTVFVVARLRNLASSWSMLFSYGDNITVNKAEQFAISVSVSGYLSFNSMDNDYISNFKVDLGKLFVAGVKYNGNGNVTIYYNGQDESGVVSRSLVTNPLVASIGSWLGISFKPHAEVYAVYIWNRALSDDEIAKLNEDPFNPNNVSKNGLVGWWDFNKADWDNGVLPDLSGNSNNGTIHGVMKRDVLIKRGVGDLPKYELTSSWVCDGIDDYVIVDFNNWAVKKALSFAVWDRSYAGSGSEIFVPDVAKGIGSYDSTKDAWRVDTGEVGYFLDKEIDYDETKFGRGIWFYVYQVQVDDNSQNVPLFRFEVVDANTGEVVFSKDYTANQFPTDKFSGIVTAGYVFLPYGRYKLRLYSYGNVGFWIKKAVFDWYHGALLHSYNSVDFELERFYRWFRLYVYKTDGSLTGHLDMSANVLKDFESFVLGWSNIDQKYVAYYDGVYSSERTDTAGLDMRGVATRIIIGAGGETIVNNRYTGEIASIMMFDRLLSDTEVSDLNNKKFVLDGLVHWWVVDENGNLVDLVTNKKYTIQGNPYIRRLYDSSGKLNNEVDAVIFDVIEEERGC